MKKVEIDLNEVIALKRGPETKAFIEAKLKKAGFDLNKFILSSVDPANMKYTYMQD